MMGTAPAAGAGGVEGGVAGTDSLPVTEDSVALGFDVARDFVPSNFELTWSGFEPSVFASVGAVPIGISGVMTLGGGGTSLLWFEPDELAVLASETGGMHILIDDPTWRLRCRGASFVFASRGRETH